ncbi:MAG: hypothetical protein PHQ27_05705 [Victivallales bacterium]|nr:hypothetical protein [Victivallales bacterium]
MTRFPTWMMMLGVALLWCCGVTAAETAAATAPNAANAAATATNTAVSPTDDAMRFLAVARRPPGRECWARMTGKVTHLRTGGKPEEAGISLAIMFTPARTLAQIIIDDQQGYLVGQKYGPGADMTSIIPLNKEGYQEPILAKFGLRPEDLTMSFIFWHLLRELPRDKVKGQECRVFVLQAPDAVDPEVVQVHISAKYFFPLKVSWSRKDGEPPYRFMEVTSFRKENDYWLVRSLIIYGPGWKTRVAFEQSQAGVQQDLPQNFFRR